MTSSAPIPVALCADDFALSPGVSRAICEMLAQQRVFATSCLTLSRHWPEHAAWLKPFAGEADLGLHLALTNFAPLSSAPTLARGGTLPGLRQILVGAVTRQLPRAEIRDELQRQFDAFESAIGRRPDYVSGHHHVHQFPVIRDIVLELLAARQPRPALRLADENLSVVWRRGVARGRSAIATLLSGNSRQRAQALGLRLNTHFAGLYDFTPELVYRDVFRTYIAGAPRGLAIMSHPGHVDAEVAALDSTVDSRPRELAYFTGRDFPADLADSGMTLSRFTSIC